MNFYLKLDLPDAEQEAVWLNSYLKENNIEGLSSSSIVETSPSEDTMDDGIFTNILELALNGGVKSIVESLIGLIFKHFDGKFAEFELMGECPDSKKKFTLKFNNTSKSKRSEVIKEFNELHEKICN